MSLQGIDRFINKTKARELSHSLASFYLCYGCHFFDGGSMCVIATKRFFRQSVFLDNIIAHLTEPQWFRLRQELNLCQTKEKRLLDALTLIPCQEK